MVILEYHIESVDEVMRNGYDAHKRWTLIHENEYVEEVRWEDGDEIVTYVSLKKRRPIVARLCQPCKKTRPDLIISYALDNGKSTHNSRIQHVGLEARAWS